MDIAALIVSVIALLCSCGCLVIMLAKNFFSTHTIQYENPFKDMNPTEIGKGIMDQYQDLDISLSQDEIDNLRGRKAKFD